jgi:hypothetical protein
VTDEKQNEQLASLRVGQAAQTEQLKSITGALLDLKEALEKITSNHESRIRRLEFAVIALALGGGTAAAKIMGLA